MFTLGRHYVIEYGRWYINLCHCSSGHHIEPDPVAVVMEEVPACSHYDFCLSTLSRGNWYFGYEKTWYDGTYYSFGLGPVHLSWY
jgi:hypothetical protein